MKMLLFLLLSLCLVTCYGKSQDDWIDPTDMLNYDAAAGRMKHQKQHHADKTALNKDSDAQVQGICQLDHLDCNADTIKWGQMDSKEGNSEKELNEIKDETMFQGCMKDLDTLRKEIKEWRKKGEIPQSSCNPVFRRFLYRIINEAELLELPDESQAEVHYDAEMVLTRQMVEEFQRFLDDTDWNVGPLDEALGGILVRFRRHNEDKWSWKFEDYIGTDPFSAFMISLSLLCIVMVVATELWTHVSWFTQIKRLLALSFLVSLVWNWLYLYKDAFAERQAKLAKLEGSHACGKQMTWSESLFEWWKSSSSFQNDPCEEYFKALMVNPILLVPPTKAFAVTFTNFITEPLKHMGKGIGEFFHALLAEMPLFYQPIVLIIIVLLLLVFCYGFGPNVHRLLWRNLDRERLPPPNPQREGYDRFIEDANGRFRSNPQPIQPRHVERDRAVLNRRPEVLHPGDCDHIHITTQEIHFVEPPDSAIQHPQRNQVALEKRTHNQYIRNDAQLQSKDDPIDQRDLSQQPVKELLEDSSQDHCEKPLKDSEPLDKISPPDHNFSGSHTEVKENRIPDVETLVNKSQFIEEAKRERESISEKDQQLIKGAEHGIGSDPVAVITSAERVGKQGTSVYPIEDHLSNTNLSIKNLYTYSGTEEDLYTCPGNEEQSESHNFVML